MLYYQSASVKLYSKDGITYCDMHYGERFADKCARCGLAVLSGGVSLSTAGTFHSQCFLCSQSSCGKSLLQQPCGISPDGAIMCSECLSDLVAPRCCLCMARKVRRCVVCCC